MNIGLVTQWFASGAGHVARSYAEVLAQKHCIYIYARGGPAMRGDQEWDGPQVTWAPHHPSLSGIHSRHFARWAKEHAIDAVLFNEQRHWSGVVLAKQLGLLTGGYVDYYTQDTVPLFNLYDFLVCNTRRHYSVFSQHPQCRYVPWGTSTGANATLPERPARPLTFIINSGWDGRYARGAPWMDRRGAGLAMRVFRRVQGTCRLIVYSQVALAECPMDWQEAADTDPRIDFRVGTFSPFPYFEGDVYVYPSRLDGIGLTLPEALSSGLPAITTDSAPMNEFVRNGENGLLVAVQTVCARPDGYYWPESLCDDESLAAAMRAYLRQPELALVHGARARQLAEHGLSWERNAADLGDWIAAQRHLSVDLVDFARRCQQYDRTHTPTPWERTWSGGYAILQEIRAKYRLG
jgi:glycosyltransferase involved in cell wall biosynthesis